MKKIFGALLCLLLVAMTVPAFADGLLLPDGLRSIGEEAFYGDYSIMSVTVPEGVEEIESRAFADSGLKQIALPASMKTIADDTFSGCDGLRITAEMGTYAYQWAAQHDLLGVEDYPDSTQVTVPATLPAGADLSLHLAGPSNAVWHNVFLLGSDGSRKTRILESKSGEVCWPGYDLEPGEYRVVVYTVTEAYDTLPAITYSLTITGEKMPGPTLELPESVRQNSEVRIPLKGDFLIRVEQYDQNGTLLYDDEYQPWDPEYLYIDSWLEDGVEGGYLLYCAAEYRDSCWTAFGPVSRVDILPFPALDAPVIHAESSYTAGEDFTISYDPVEHAEKYDVALNKTTNDYGFSYTVSAPQAIICYGYQLDPGTYRLKVSASAPGYKSSSKEYLFTVLPNPVSAPAVSVDRNIVNANEKYTFTIDTSGAEELRYRIGSYDYGTINVLDVETLWTVSRSYGGTVTYRFCVYRDGRWSSWSEPITVNIREPEPLPEPLFILPDTLNEGQDLTVTVEKTPTATQYTVYLYNSRGTQLASRSINSADGGTVIFEGFRMTAGEVKVRVSAYSGSASSQSEQSLRIQTGNRPQAPQASAESPTAQYGSRARFTVNAEGAAQAAVRYYQLGYTNNVNYETFTVNGDSTSWYKYMYNSAGTYRFSFAAKYEGVWSAWSEGVEITVE